MTELSIYSSIGIRSAGEALFRQFERDSGLSLAVTWAPPTDGGAATGYMVLYRQAGTTAWTLAAQGGAATALTISGLTSGMAYAVAVLATNAAGPGPLSAPAGPYTAA